MTLRLRNNGASPPPAPPASTTKRRFETLGQIASRWRCHRTTVRRLLEAAGVPGYRLGADGRGVLRYDADDVEAYERRCRRP